MAGREVAVPFFVQVEPTYTSSGGATSVASAKVVALTQGRPERQRPGTVLVKLTVAVDEQHLLQAGGHRG